MARTDTAAGQPWRPRRPRLGTCYYPEHWPQERWDKDARDMHAAGIRVVRLAEFAWSRLEPQPGQFSFEWLDDALEVMHRHRLQVILCTPTATPPRWMLDQHPDMLALDAEGRPRQFGSRRHYCFSHIGYRRESRRITNLMAQRYGEHPAVVAWQTDNEYGCHDTVLSYSAAARDGFRQWLRDRYGEIDSLNVAWGNVFWSMEYRDFAEIDLPILTVTEGNPSHRLDFQRYSSDQVASFNRAQVEELRRLSPGRSITHNYMGRSEAFDHRATGADLDVAGWDSYPLGFATWLHEARPHETRLHRYLRIGDPDFQAFHHDLYRGVGNGRMWVVEQQPGPVNWAAANPLPLPGALRLWAHEAIAHGAELVSYFRWRQAPFAQEQMHAGLLLPDGEEAPGLAEVREVAAELKLMRVDPVTGMARVALVYDYEAGWYGAIQPQSEGWDYQMLLLDMYRALRRNGVDVDIIGPGDSLAGYAMVVVAGLDSLSPSLAHQLNAYEGELVIGPRTGAKTEHFQIPADLPPGPLASLTGMRVVRIDALPNGYSERFTWRNGEYTAHTWREEAEAIDAAPIGHFDDGLVPLWRCGNVNYLACWPDHEFLKVFFAERLTTAKISRVDMPSGIRTRTHGKLRFVFNHNSTAQPLPIEFERLEMLVGENPVRPAGVCVLREPRTPQA